MKKIISALLLTAIIAFSFTACTDENVAPKTNDTTQNGGGIDPKGN